MLTPTLESLQADIARLTTQLAAVSSANETLRDEHFRHLSSQAQSSDLLLRCYVILRGSTTVDSVEKAELDTLLADLAAELGITT